MQGSLTALFVPNTATFEVFFDTIRNTPVIFIWIGYWLGFVILAAVEALIFEVFFPKALHDATYTHATPFFTLIIAIIFSQWFTKARYGYTDTPEHYAKLLLLTQTFSSTFFGLLRSNAIILKELEQPTPAQPTSEKPALEQPTIDDHITRAAIMMRDCCVNHVASGYLLFSSEQPDDLKGLNDDLTKEIESCMSTYRNLARTQVLMVEQLQRMERLNILNKSGLELLYRHMDKLQEAVAAVESSGLLVDPGIFDKLMLSAMFIYLMLWIPFQQ